MEIGQAEAGFGDWEGLLALILAAFAGMAGRIDPPSSALRLTPAGLAAKAAAERLILAREEGGRLAGCAFAVPRGGWLYVGKLAVAPDRQGRGIGRALLAAAEEAAGAAGLAGLELETRVELHENHAAFVRMGFAEVGRTAHPGFERPTSITFRRPCRV